jgi:acylphosphatase
MSVSVQLRVTGKVQGVYYRQSTQRKAEALGLKGYVQNEQDGSVFVHVEGQQAQVDELIAWCKRGPDAAAVAAVAVQPAEYAGYTSFDIRRRVG